MTDVNSIITSVLLVAAAFSSCLLGLIVLIRNPERITHRVFALLTLNLTMWALGVFFIVHSHDADSARLWVMVTFGVAAFLPGTFYHFIGYFPDQNFKGMRWYLYLLYASAFVLTAMVNTDWYIQGLEVFPDKPPSVIEYGHVFHAYTVMIVVTMVLMFANLFRKLSRSEGIQRRQIEHVLGSIFIGISFAIATNVLLPALFDVGSMELYGPCFLVLMMAGLAYSMIRYHLLDIWVIVSRTTTYAIVTVIVFILYFSVVTAVHTVFTQAGPAYNILSIALTSLVVAIIIQPLREHAQLLLDRIVRHRRYDTEALTQRLSRLASQFVQLDQIMERVFLDLRQTMGVTGLRVLLVDPNDDNRFEAAFSTTADTDPQTPCGDYVLEYIRNHPEPLLREEIEHRAPILNTRRLAKQLRNMGAQVLIPLATQTGVLGMILLKKKETGDIYTHDDWRVFATVAAPLAAAIENARLYARLEELNVHLELLLRNMRGVVIAVDTQGVITTVNLEGRKLFPDIAPGMALGVLDPKVAHLLQMTLDNRRGILDVETSITGGKEDEIPVAMSTSCLEMPEQSTLGAMVLIHNMTQIKRLEANVQRADRLTSIGTMAAGMAHEIKNPLQSIKTFTQLLLDRYDDADFRNTFAEVVPPEVDRIDNIVTRLLHFARPQPVSFNLHDLRKIINDVFALVENQLRKNGIALNLDMPTQPVGVMADNQQLHQVFLNLVLNAIESMKNSSNSIIDVRIHTGLAHFQQPGVPPRHDVPCVKAVISDTGCGITQQHIKQLFTPFFTTKVEGSGLGLSVVHGIITEHRGAIDVSSNPGVGSSFTVTFPLAGNTEAIERVGL
ncbi:MAG: ATP-binding protein [Candidatus Hydrogenedentes bacterium]|nr:ATP-binding protein [Candidatus Hydrogenedentota bacterium]